MTAPIHFNWKPPEWSGFDIRHPTSSEPAKRMSNPKARLELMFASVVIEGGCPWISTGGCSSRRLVEQRRCDRFADTTTSAGTQVVPLEPVEMPNYAVAFL